MQSPSTRSISTSVFGLVCSIAWLFLAPPVSADSIFSDEASFLTAATGPLTLESFEGLALDTGITQSSLALTGFTMASQANTLGVRDTPKPGVDGTQYVVYAATVGSTLTITFDSPVTEFGVRIMDALDIATGSLSASTNGGSTFNAFLTSPLVNDAEHYLGIITDVPFTVLTLTTSQDGADGLLFDGLRFNSVPEPSTAAFLALILGALATRRERSPIR